MAKMEKCETSGPAIDLGKLQNAFKARQNDESRAKDAMIAAIKATEHAKAAESVAHGRFGEAKKAVDIAREAMVDGVRAIANG